MSLTPKISVVMAVFNGQPYVTEAVKSILYQTFRDFEFIIVDNHSTDGTPDVIGSFDDPRIILVRNERNLGQTEALNIGIHASKAPYIARMDADDYSYPERLQAQYDYIEEHDSIAVLGSQFLEMDETGRTIRRRFMPVDPLEVKGVLSCSIELSYNAVAHPTVMMRRSAILAAGLYDNAFLAQDYDLWVRLSRRHLITNLDRVLFKYRIRKNAQSWSLRDGLRRSCAQTVLNNIRHFCPQFQRDELFSLWRMLNFLPQRSRDDARSVLDLFGIFFDRVAAPYQENRKIKMLKEKLILFYLPQLFYLDQSYALRRALAMIAAGHTVLADIRFYSKIVKACLQNSRKDHHCAEMELAMQHDLSTAEDNYLRLSI